MIFEALARVSVSSAADLLHATPQYRHHPNLMDTRLIR